ncbi:thiol:disulfide interchange protein [Acetobacter estunensis NRIC 0472]|uniref:Thioredoxin domain-containing protein n=1 Tax=Acetobacter estunensis TaxID=104097 RepID=A0A967EH36_9PROT|nr:thioredoxin domain-containing protein [Acetobacter estunensis]NHO53122.1 thioredoxin domain-containing protein [Acetobacter estunensis]GBQ24767.1 thiol:disulfide interchange protein [Acetobacter estunensis NRIC 0472]
MSITRRALLGATLPAALAPAFLSVARAAGTSADPRMAPRALGNPSAKVTVEEWFSLTCTHCARFAIDVFPEVQKKLIDTGRIRYVFCDFPLDRIALMAAQVARALPAERYEAFILSLFSNQDRWAFIQDGNPEDQLRKMAGLAGMSADNFDRTVNDVALRDAIMAEQNRAEAQYHIDSTPTFRFNDEVYRQGELTYDAFEKKVVAAGG